MEGSVSFQFRDIWHTANYLICQRQDPVYMFIFFSDETLITEFGQEICIHSVNNQLLDDNIFSGKRLELYTNIFNQVMAKYHYDHHARTIVQHTTYEPDTNRNSKVL
jgi:hypothetical protein